MKHVSLLIAIFVTIFLVSSNYISEPKFETPTGGLVYTPPYKEEGVYSYTLGDWVNGFYQVRGLVWPRSACTMVAKELYDSVATAHLTVSEDISTFGEERMSNIMFGIEQEKAGAVEMIYGNGLLNKYPGDSAMHVYVESVVRIPHVDRASQIHLNLFGYSEDYFYITYGKIITPTITCEFTSEDGLATCNCTYGLTTDYRY